MKRQLWSSWSESLDGTYSGADEINKSFSAEKYVKKFGYREKSMFGTSPSWDKFYLVNCKLCGSTIKPQDLQDHLERKHSYSEMNVSKQIKSAVEANCSRSSWMINAKSEKKGLKLLFTRKIDKNRYECRDYQSKVEQSISPSASLIPEETKSNIRCTTSSDSQERIVAQSPSLPSNKSMPPICSNQETPDVEILTEIWRWPYQIFKDNQTVSSNVKSNGYEMYSTPSSVCTFKMNKNGVILCTNTDAVRQTCIKNISPRKRKCANSEFNAVLDHHSTSNVSDSSTTDTMKSRPFLMPKYSDIYYQSDSHVTYPNGQILSNETHLSKLEVLHKNITEENQCVRKPLMNTQVHQQVNDIYQWKPLQHATDLNFTNSYHSWEPSTDYSFQTDVPKNTEKINMTALNSHLGGRFDELQSQLLVSKAAVGT